MELATKRFVEMPKSLPYRVCAGIILINAHGQVWIGQRRQRSSPKTFGWFWQMPQGGIDPSESPRDAAIRELREETGVTSAEIIAEMTDWQSYDLPGDLVGIALKGRYRGQRQKWFAMRFTGDDSEITIAPKGSAKAEFQAWRWAELSELSGLAIDFKKPIYEAVIREFAPLVDSITSGRKPPPLAENTQQNQPWAAVATMWQGFLKRLRG